MKPYNPKHRFCHSSATLQCNMDYDSCFFLFVFITRFTRKETGTCFMFYLLQIASLLLPLEFENIEQN